MRSPLGTLFAKAPVPYTSRGGRLPMGTAFRNNSESQMRAYGSVGTLFSIVNRTSTATAQVDWKLWRKAKSGKKDDRVEVTSHLALDIWHKPNPFYTRQKFVESVEQHVDLTGEGWWVIARDERMRSVPLEIWPVRPDRMEPIPSRDEFIAGYIYRSPDGEQVPLRRDEVIQLRMPNPLDPYRGMGPVQSILTDLDSTKYSAEWNRNFFLNSATPGGIIEVPNNWSDDEFDEFRDRWDEQHRGVEAAHRVGILEGGAKWVERTYSMRDMQFVELREVSSKVIREAFGMPKFAIGDVEDVNRATAEASKSWFAEMLTVPRLERFKQALNADFLPLFGATAVGLEFDYEDPVPPNAEARDRERTSKAEAAEKLVRAGYTGDSVVEALELPDSLVWKEPEPAPQPAPPAAPVQPEKPPAPVETPDAILRAFLAKADDQDRIDQLIEQAMQAIRAAFEAAIAALLSAWDAITGRQREQLVEQVRQAVEDGDVSALTELSADTDDAKAELTAAMVALAAIGAQQIADEADAQGVTVEPVEPVEEDLSATAGVVVALLAAGLAASAAGIALHLWTRGADAVAQAVDDHLRTLSDRALKDKLGGALHGAQHAGRIATLADAPEATLIASEMNDSLRCSPCGAIDGTRFASLADAELAYPGGSYWACYGGNRCRGEIVPIWEAE